MRGARRHYLGLRIAVISVGLASLFSCVIVPTRLPTQIRDANGNSAKLDFAFLKTGSTTRDEVVKQLSPIDTHAGTADFFWGRWAVSNWGYGGVVVAPPIGAGGGGSRVWKAKNLLTGFDQHGVLKSWQVVDDKKLFAQLDALEGPATQDFDHMAQTKVKVLLPRQGQSSQNPTSELTISSELLECWQTWGRVTIPRGNLRKITQSSNDAAKMNPDYVWITIHFVPTERRGVKNLWIGVDPPTLLLLRQYSKQDNRRESLLQPRTHS